MSDDQIQNTMQRFWNAKIESMSIFALLCVHTGKFNVKAKATHALVSNSELSCVAVHASL